MSPAAPLHHFGLLKGLLSALAARGFQQLVARLDADLADRDNVGAPILVGAYVAFAVSTPRMFDLMWRDDLLIPDDVDLAHARRLALKRLQTQSEYSTSDGDGRLRAIRTWSLAHGLATLLLHGRIVKALGDAEAGLETPDDFVALAHDRSFSDP